MHRFSFWHSICVWCACSSLISSHKRQVLCLLMYSLVTFSDCQMFSVGQVPLMLQRLHEFRVVQEDEEKNKRRLSTGDSEVRHFANIGCSDTPNSDTSLLNNSITDVSPTTGGGSEPTPTSQGPEQTPSKNTANDSTPLTPSEAMPSPIKHTTPKPPRNTLRLLPLPAELAGSQTPGMSGGTPSEEGPYRSSLKRALSPGHSSDHSAPKRSRLRNDGGGERCGGVLLPWWWWWWWCVCVCGNVCLYLVCV